MVSGEYTWVLVVDTMSPKYGNASLFGPETSSSELAYQPRADLGVVAAQDSVCDYVARDGFGVRTGTTQQLLTDLM